jgi:hypothetical protein
VVVFRNCCCSALRVCTQTTTLVTVSLALFYLPLNPPWGAPVLAWSVRAVNRDRLLKPRHRNRDRLLQPRRRNRNRLVQPRCGRRKPRPQHRLWSTRMSIKSKSCRLIAPARRPGPGPPPCSTRTWPAHRTVRLRGPRTECRP